MSTTARLFIDPMPELGDGVRRIQIDCKWATTTAYLIPAPDLTDAQLIASLLLRHEAQCGRCRTERLWQHADLETRQAIEQAWLQLGAVALRERRN